jgi:hypothetical protein
MREKKRPLLNRGLFLPIGVTLLFTWGCARPLRVSDPDAARQCLITALDAWKSGSDPSSLREQVPAIVVGDLDWKQGFTLLHYQVSEAGTFDGQRLRVPVTLSVKAGRKKTVILNTSYVVSTSPAVTIIREME